MRRASLADFRAEPDKFLRESQLDDIVVTDDGEPIALVRGVQLKDEEDRGYETDPEFWEMILARRRETAKPLEEVEAELYREDPSLRAIVEAARERATRENGPPTRP